MTTVVHAADVREHAAARIVRREIRVALLGLGQVGGAIAALAQQQVSSAQTFTITSALVRDPHRRRTVDTTRIPLTVDPSGVLRDRPDVAVEVLGGLEPARTLVLEALAAGVPVVTANKSLLAAHGDELFDAAARHGVPLLYEASVLAGVPFLGTFHRRPLARDVTAIRGIVNGTSNYILSRMAQDPIAFGDALAEAQRRGYAEPDPSKDVGGDDAVEKLCVLLRHFAQASVAPSQIEKTGITAVDDADLRHASAFGGRVRPVIAADWDDGRISAFAGPAFVDRLHPLARIDGVQNAVSLSTRWSGDLFFSGPGAGPTVTAATVLDDVVEAINLIETEPLPVALTRPRRACAAPDTAWFVRLTGDPLSNETLAPQALAALGIRIRRASALDRHDGQVRQWLLTGACTRSHADAALDVVAAKLACTAQCMRVLE
jgi:homoserine dehydrogenase